MITAQSDRKATIILMLVILVLLGVGLMEYMQSDRRAAVQQLAQQEAALNARITGMKQRAATVEQQEAKVAELERYLLPADKGNYYAQSLLATVAVQRASGVKFPTYTFADNGAIGRHPRLSISGAASGTNEQIYAFIQGLEEGPHRVQVSNFSYSGRIANTDQGSQASVNLTLIYTAQPNK